MESPNPSVFAAPDEKFKSTLPLVFQYFYQKELLRIRSVSKTWNRIILSKNLLSKLVYNVNDKVESIEAFRKLSPSFKITQFRFSKLDLETGLFGDALTFRRFTLGHCLNMTSLTIQNCSISTGRFLELLAFCKKLRKLNLRNVPSLYKVDDGIGIIHWAFCFKYVKENLAKIESIAISEDSGFSHKDIWGLACGMINLRCLHIGSEGPLPLPIRSIMEVLKVCSKTLKSLALRGKISAPGLKLAEGIELTSLRKLMLIRSKIDSGTVKEFRMFLDKCPNLEDLHIHECKLESTTLSGVQNNLTTLVLQACDIGDNAFENAEFKKLDALRAHLSPQNVTATSDIISGLVSLLKCKKPKLSSLVLELPSDGCSYIKHLNVSDYSKLTSLSLYNCVDLAGRSLRKIFREFTNLRSLSIFNCKELTDENVCCMPNNDVKDSLANLENLETINLSGTIVGNRTVNECIIKMKRLEFIRLANTKVDENGLREIMNSVSSTLTSLKIVTLSHCAISNEEFNRLSRLAPSVKVECTIIK